MQNVRYWIMAFVLFGSLTQVGVAQSADSQDAVQAPGSEKPVEQPRRVGGGVLPPKVLSTPTPHFTKEAKKAKVSGSVLVYLQVDKHGDPQKLRVLRGIGYGLDEDALKTVSQYKFAPALLNGEPVLIEMNVEVNYVRF